MIAGIFHQGSGLGNQLHRYVAARVIALDNGWNFGMVNPENFKGKSFMNLDMGQEALETFPHTFIERRIDNENGVDIRPYDERVQLILDNTLIDGEFQDEQYFDHRLNKVRKWLRVKKLNVPDDVCVINFRGGEYVGVKDLFLPAEYWRDGIEMMLSTNPKMRFQIHTDDPAAAFNMFLRLIPGEEPLDIIHDMEINWRSIRYAKYLLLSNSSFAILPALLNERAERIIAPKYWARRNLGFWALPQNEYKDFDYI